MADKTFGSGFLKDAFLAVASCVVVHAGFDFIALAGGPNLWELLVNPLTDGAVSLFNSTVASPAAAATLPPSLSGGSLLTPSTENFIPPIENTLQDGCHTHLDGTMHCGKDEPPSVEW